MILTEGKTEREVFEEIAAAIVAQGGQCSSADNGPCLYGDEKGRHCAVGWLLPEDDQRLMSAEGRVSDLLRIFNAEKLGPNADWISSRLEMLTRAQDVHDYDNYGLSREVPVEDPAAIWDRCYPHLSGVWDEWVALRIEQRLGK